MPPNRNAPDEEYKKLVEEIHTAHTSLTQSMTDTINSRVIIRHIKDLLILEAELMEMMRLAYWQEDSSAETSVDDKALKRITPNLLRLIADSLDSGLSSDFQLPNPGAKEWYGILVYVTLLSDYSRPVEFPPQPKEDPKTNEDPKTEEEEEDNGPECGICIAQYQDLARDVSFPCHESHRMCTSCLRTLVCAALLVKCPYCRQSPFL
ncbi:hypothetical protein DFH28DRAFT_608376 [Melampsora americana]|nr:hypothetical protein DFH28DRAFT_608376 [Melampsora americana]